MADTCTAHRTQYGIELRCQRTYGHKGHHRWAKDEGFYPFGRLNPGNLLDQALVAAWNRAVRKAEERR